LNKTTFTTHTRAIDGQIASDGLFMHDTVLPDDPVGDDGEPLESLHDREYRVRAYRKTDDLMLIRGAVRDQKPPGLYLADDPEPLTIHHMQVDIEVSLPSMEIVTAAVGLEIHPNAECPRIEQHYDKLVGLSIARGFTHKVRELFGGPRGCTHTTALLQAMAPVAIQCIWSMRAAAARRNESGQGLADLSPEQREGMWQMNLNTCHVWAEDSEVVANLRSGGESDAPVFVTERLVKLGLKPDDWHRTMGN